MATQDVHKKISDLEAKIAKLEKITQNANQLKSNIKKQRDQNAAKTISAKLKNG